MNTPDGIRPKRIEDYALIGNCKSVALVGRNGSIDWMCLPRFDSPACFAALLGTPNNGRWLLAPASSEARVTREYLGATLILDTIFDTADGTVCVRDFMSDDNGRSSLRREVKGVRGRVAMHLELTVRFDYGAVTPWVCRQDNGCLQFTAGPDRLLLQADVELRGEHMSTVGDFYVEAGEEVAFCLSWTPSYGIRPQMVHSSSAFPSVLTFWGEWSKRWDLTDEWRQAVSRSLLTLKALTHRDSGGMVAAGTASLPECPGGQRNWDYRFCWLRDATFTLYAFLGAGCLDEARAWRLWLIRAVGGSPDRLQTVYGVGGERRLPECEVGWLSGFGAATPVRIGNAAAGQMQLDVYGEVLDALFVARKSGLGPDAASWSLECALLAHLETIWRKPDKGIWEMRNGHKQFTYSKVMAWVAFDRAVRSVEELGLDGPVTHWRAIRDVIHREVCEHGIDAGLNAFVQSYGSTTLDASLLLVPLVGFLPPDDPRIRGTVAAVEQYLLEDGLVLRYRTGVGKAKLPPGEGAFLACSFWLADNYVLQGRQDEARELFERLLSLRNDVGLLAEEYDPRTRRQLGNFPQALSHLALINTARNLTGAGPAHDRSARSGANRSTAHVPGVAT